MGRYGFARKQAVPAANPVQKRRSALPLGRTVVNADPPELSRMDRNALRPYWR